jgi:hypothetical protein
MPMFVRVVYTCVFQLKNARSWVFWWYTLKTIKDIQPTALCVSKTQELNLFQFCQKPRRRSFQTERVNSPFCPHFSSQSVFRPKVVAPNQISAKKGFLDKFLFLTFWRVKTFRLIEKTKQADDTIKLFSNNYIYTKVS